jgi:hypothetical protein
MKRFLLTVVFCTSLLVLLSQMLFPVAEATEDPIVAMLNLPAPPPPNPQASISTTEYPPDFFNKSRPPADDAPIEALLAYWRRQSDAYSETQYRVYPSDKALDRILDAIEKKPAEIVEYINILPRGERSERFVKGIYDGISGSREEVREVRATLREWMKYNTRHFSSELARQAERVADKDGYVTNHEALVALARVDWDRANPIVSRLYADPRNKASQIAARWALYVHAIESGSSSDIERYRDELKAVVADKSLSHGMRDLALDALSLEKDWDGRDEWYLSLLEDDSLLDLGGYTGLTTLFSHSPEGKYIDRMIALLDSDNINVRSAAAQNLVTKLHGERTADIVKALLPWLSNPKWLRPETDGRHSLVRSLASIKSPESVPALIALLDERHVLETPRTGANTASNSIDAASWAMNTAANAANSAVVAAMRAAEAGEMYAYRISAIRALQFQGDSRAVPALRRLLAREDSTFSTGQIVSAIYHCDGFSLAEQVSAIEHVVAEEEDETEVSERHAINGVFGAANAMTRLTIKAYDYDGQPGADPIRLLGIYLAGLDEVKDDLGRAVVARIIELDKSDPNKGKGLRRIVMRWKSPAVFALFLNDVRNDKAGIDDLVLLLTNRKDLRQHQQKDVYELRTGSPTAIGFSACLLEDPNDMLAVLDGPNETARIAMLACARLIRSPLPLEKVARKLTSKDPTLRLAAERYLESEDSPEARRIVLSMHPGEAKILGASTAFYVGKNSVSGSLALLFATVVPYHGQSEAIQNQYVSGLFNDVEGDLTQNLKKDPNLLGIYNWKDNFVHLYKEKAVLSWREDPARFRERPLTAEETSELTSLIAHHKMEQSPPFLECSVCEAFQLTMVGRNGGRRVYVKTSQLPPAFAELDHLFLQLRDKPAAIKYWASRDVPGLELLFASDRLDALAVWKSGADFRLCAVDREQKKEIEDGVEDLVQQATEEFEGDQRAALNKVAKEMARRSRSSANWFSIVSGTLGEPTSQPLGFEMLPEYDDLLSHQRWVATAGTVEVRADEKGLSKIVGGKATKIRTGWYDAPVITANARWVVVRKIDEEEGSQLVRVNLTTNREYPIGSGELPNFVPIAFVASINRVLIGPNEAFYGGDHEDPVEDADNSRFQRYAFLDPETGRMVPATGEIRPIAQQKQRPLQPGPGPFEHWAAIPKKGSTEIGIYSSRHFTFRPVLSLPKMNFNSMDMWVDATENRVYFVYKGHLLAAPLKVAR